MAQLTRRGRFLQLESGDLVAVGRVKDRCLVRIEIRMAPRWKYQRPHVDMTPKEVAEFAEQLAATAEEAGAK